MKRIVATLLTFIAVLAANAAMARVTIDITQGNVDPMPIAAPDFLGDDDSTASLGRDITSVLMNDLERSGLFQVIDQRAYIEKPEGVNIRPRFADWRIINSQVLIVGGVEELPDGRMQVSTRIWDVYADEQLGAVAFKTPADNWRRAAHKVADFVYKTLTGEAGYFDTRVVFVHETGPKERRVKRLMIMDQDGANPVPLTDGLKLSGADPALFTDTATDHLYGAF